MQFNMYRVLILLTLAAEGFVYGVPTPAPFHRPLVFEPNRGQAPADVTWLAHGDGYQLFFTEQSITMLIVEVPLWRRTRTTLTALQN